MKSREPKGRSRSAGLVCTCPGKRDLSGSGINQVDQSFTRKVLETAARLGIRQYRMDYYKYDLNKPLPPQVKSLQSSGRELAALNRGLGIHGIYHNHAGAQYAGAGIWDMHQILEGIPPSEIGFAYDIRHASAEGGTTWRTTWNLVQPQLAAVFIKNTRWVNRKMVDGPLGMPDGVVDLGFYSLLKASIFQGPISLHVEYLPKDPPGVQIAAIRQNLAELLTLMK